MIRLCVQFLGTFCACLLVHCLYAQDIIVKRNGEELQVKVKSVSDSVITYQFKAAQDSGSAAVINTIPIAEVAMIKYESGRKLSFADAPQTEFTPVVSPTYTRPAVASSDLYNKGRGDAMIYYQGYRGAATGTLIVSLLSPLVGLIPAVACSATSPNPYRMVTPDSKMLNNREYQAGYLREARRIKSRHVWKNWGIAFGVNLALILLVSN